MKDQVLEVRWVRGNLSPEDMERKLRAAFRLILDASRQCSENAPVVVELPDDKNLCDEGPAEEAR